jgi:diguanylate cyclase (GGDEF)-like protein/PAS domain S-box-containing protein
VVAANDFGAGLVGRVPAELAGRAFVSLLHEEDRAEAAARLAECAGDAGRAHRWPARLLRRNGTAAWTEQIGRALPGDGEGGPHVLVLCQDVSAHREAGEALEAARARVAGILESITDGFFALDAAWRFTYVNREAERMLRRARGELLGRTYWECFPRAEGSVFAREYRRVMDERVPAVFEAPSTSLPDVWFQVHAYPCEGGVASYFHDVTSRREAEEALRSLSLVDDLTGLHNRRGLGTLARQQMRVAERTGRGFTLLFLDVDGLKAVNDALGHPAGDRLLSDVAAVLRETFREADVLARLGGDEFAVLALDDGDGDGDAAGETVVERLRARVAVHNQVSPRPYALSVSVGAVRYDPARPTTLDDLLRAADARMYEEKRQKQPIVDSRDHTSNSDTRTAP